MLATLGLDLHGKILLLIGNGPSSWWLKPQHLAAMPDYVVTAACNRTAALLRTDFACAVDRAMVDEFLNLGIYHRTKLLVADAVLREALRDRGEAPAGLVDAAAWANPPGNCFVLPTCTEGSGTGEAAFATFLTMGLDLIYLIGFDGPGDPRTRWQGTESYKSGGAPPHVLQEWERRMVRDAEDAIDQGRVGYVGGAMRPDSALCMLAKKRGGQRKLHDLDAALEFENTMARLLMKEGGYAIAKG